MASIPSLEQAIQAALTVIAPLELWGVLDRGKPNEERIYIKATERAYLGHYFLMPGIRISDNDAMPFNNCCFWFGARVVEKGTWIIVYTGPGVEAVTKIQGTNDPAWVFHWGLAGVLFRESSVVPCLVKTDPSQLRVGKPG